MPCYRKVDAWYRPAEVKRSVLTGEMVLKKGLTFRRPESWEDLCRHVQVPCGKCVGCRLKYSKDWAVRCHHEAQLHEESSYLTLTYADHRLPKDGSVKKRELQLFFKKLRKWCESNREGWLDDCGRRKYFRYFACGEYGDLNDRPHYHALIFGVDFWDKKFFKKNHNGDPLFTSEEAQSIWSDEHGPIGFVTLGAVSFKSAAYVARYIMKKQSGEKAEAHYRGRSPEFVLGSRKPGLGRLWIERYYSDVYPKDEIHIDGKAYRPPRFYDDVYAERDPKAFARLKRTRIIEGRAAEDHPSRTAVKEKVKEAQVASLIRPLA